MSNITHRKMLEKRAKLEAEDADSITQLRSGGLIEGARNYVMHFYRYDDNTRMEQSLKLNRQVVTTQDFLCSREVSFFYQNEAI